MTPLFSIIIPIYNVEAYLGNCLDSVLAQTYAEFEAVCINDGSTDGSLAVLEKYTEKDSRVKILSQPNGGLSATRNAGMELAQGECLLFLDSDDLLRRDALSKLAEAIEAENPDIMAFNSELYSQSDGCTEPNTLFNHGENKTFAEGMGYFDDFVKTRGWGPSAVCFYAFRRKLLVKNNLKFEIGLLHEDELFMPQVLFYAGKVTVLPETLYTYRIHGQSITRKQKEKNFTDKLLVAERLYEFFKAKRLLSPFICRNTYNLTLSGVQGLMATAESRKKIKLCNRKIIGKIAHTKKECFIALLIRINVKLYHIYYKFVKG